MQALLGISDRLVYDLEEDAVCAWEKNLYGWLHDPKHHVELESWSQAIKRKIQ